jgi:hypothetical protein
MSGLLVPVAEAPDFPLHDLRRELAARNVHVNFGAIWRFFAQIQRIGATPAKVEQLFRGML